MKTTLKKGVYFIGDPCYMFDGSWGKILEGTDYFQAENQIINKKKVFCDGTAYGDGCYFDQDGNEYGVDAGLLGALPISLLKVDNKYTKDELSRLGRIVKFDADFDCESDKGVFDFGHIHIDTRN
jgi:hypothetical protein